MLYAASGSLIRTYTASSSNSKVSSGVRTWTVMNTFSTPGTHTVSFRCGMSTTPTRSYKKVSFTVDGSVVGNVTRSKAILPAGNTQTFTVRTSASAKYLMLYAASGSLIRTYTASSSNSTVSNGVRTWTVMNAFSTAGNHTVTFRCGISTTPTRSSNKVSFTVDGSVVGNTTRSKAILIAGNTQTFTVRTSASAKYLMMYAASGTLIRTYTASSSNSKVSNGVRTWTVMNAFSTPGKHTVTFRCGISTTPTRSYKSVSFTVDGSTVISASVASSKVIKGYYQSFTVVTNTEAQYLKMYNSSGRVIRTLTASENSSISGNTRVWSFSQIFTTEGTWTFTFRAGISSTPTNNSRQVSFTVKARIYRALVIGQENFTWDDKGPCTRNTGDAMIMERMLRSVSGPDGSTYTVRKEKDLTQSGVLSAISSAFSGATDDDVSLFFIATHGRSHDSYGQAWGSPYDGALSMCPDGELYLSDLANALAAVPGKVIVILESCGSGAAVYTPGSVENSVNTASFTADVVRAFSKVDSGLMVDPATNVVSNGAVPNTGELIRENKFYVLTASRYTQDSYGYETYDASTSNNYFTKWLVDGVTYSGSMPADTNSDHIVTLNELFLYIDKASISAGKKSKQAVQVYPKNSNYGLFKR